MTDAQKLNAPPMPIFVAQLRAKIREDDKTETRRMHGLEQVNKRPDDWKLARVFKEIRGSKGKTVTVAEFINKKSWRKLRLTCPYGYAGQVRYLREPIRKSKENPKLTVYHDDGSPIVMDGKIVKWRWKNSTLPQIHLPKIYARRFFEIVEIGCERLKDISETSALAEGINFECKLPSGANQFDCLTRDKAGMPFLCFHQTARNAFFCLFASIHGNQLVKKSPWIWVIKLKKISP